MISTRNCKTVQIQITTYTNEYNNNMCDDKCKNLSSRFICSICLNNKKVEDKNDSVNSRRRSQSCPICHRHCESCKEYTDKPLNPNTKVVQTSQTDITQGYNLLNEVLTVFQHKKLEPAKDRAKTKDASVATEHNPKNVARLSQSKVFRFSINDEEKVRDHPKFIVLNCFQPELKSHHSLLTKHKSSSIPQMKLEELKYSLKEKTKSKDAIEEVNRMFATVRKYDRNLDDSNRPMVRSGPRVLPVVKTKTFESANKKDSVAELERKISCKCCQTENDLSGGDSKEFCRCLRERQAGKCDKCLYTLTYHHRIKSQAETFCECCKRHKDCCHHDAKDSSTNF